MFDIIVMYGIALEDTFLVNATRRVQTKMRVDGYCVPTNSHIVSNQEQEYQMWK